VVRELHDWQIQVVGRIIYVRTVRSCQVLGFCSVSQLYDVRRRKIFFNFGGILFICVLDV
jgi:hypothetical protein